MSLLLKCFCPFFRQLPRQDSPMRSILLALTLVTPLRAADLSAETWTSPDGAKVIYRLAVPEKPEAGKLYPLVLFLHGSGERGTDNSSQLKHGVTPILDGAEKSMSPVSSSPPNVRRTNRGRYASIPNAG